MRTGRISVTAVILAAMIAATGCSSAMTRKTESVEGARIERQAVIDGIKPGETTRQTVIDAFGPPTSVSAEDGSEKITYEFKEKKVPVYFGVVENETARTETSATLEVIFKGDIVSSFRYRASEK